MSESENRAANWTVGLIGSIVLHAAILGLFMFVGTGDSVAATEDDDIPEMKAPSEPEESEGTVEPVTPAPSPKYYVVQKGDYASRIAAKFGLTVQQLAALNGTTVKRLNGLAVGQKLKVAE